MGWFQRFQHRNTQPLSPSRPSVSANLGGLLKPFSGVVPNSGWLKYPKYSSPMFLFFYHQLSPGYPVVNIQKSMERSPFVMGKLTISMAMFNSYFDKLPEGMSFWFFWWVWVKILRRYRGPLGGWSLRSIDWSSLGVVSPSSSEDPRGMFKGDSRASVSKKRQPDSINDSEKTLELGFEKPRFQIPGFLGPWCEMQLPRGHNGNSEIHL